MTLSTGKEDGVPVLLQELEAGSKEQVPER